MPIGTVKFFDNAKGYGFITNEAGGNDAFVHVTAVEAAGMRTLEKEQRISYDLENDNRGKTSASRARRFLRGVSDVGAARILPPTCRGGSCFRRCRHARKRP